MKKIEKLIVKKPDDLWEQIDNITQSVMQFPTARPPESFTSDEFRKRYPHMTFHQARWRLRKMLTDGLILRHGWGIHTFYTIVQKT